MGKYRGQVEELDTATTKKEAIYLTQEYRIAYRTEWTIWWKRKGTSNKCEIPLAWDKT
jgi:hypothetical protein